MGPLALVLAGGRGRRLGADGPKAGVRLAGQSLLARALAALAPLAAERVVVAPDAIPLELTDAVTRFADPGEGPLTALVSATAGRSSPLVVWLAADLPFAGTALLEALEARREGAPAVAAVASGALQPMAGWADRDGIVALAREHAAGERSLSRALQAIGARLVPAASLPGGERAFLDVDTPQDLAEAERRLSERAT